MLAKIMSKPPPFKCLFCLSSSEAFVRVEHPIPESLGNDDTVLEPGFVCDTCNQYFGSKIEHFVVNAPPFGVERVRLDIKTKRGKHPKFVSPPHIELHPTPMQDQVVLAASPAYWNLLQSQPYLLLPHTPRNDFLLARFLLKIGLELLILFTEVDPYTSIFDNARRYARAPRYNDGWQIGYGLYPRKEDLVISVREDELSPIITQQLYQYDMGIMPNGDAIFSFIYRTHIFSCNLSNPSIEDYVQGFNALNNLSLEVIDTKTLK
jgi:hypothetical protein